ncbi:MAG: hypothetical protein KDK56_06225 [Simkania sp.]|nr:hypothetical protein [Simkania sp.]MCP5490299.1 hypothetical protein [Chlamydiales bacterium]
MKTILSLFFLFVSTQLLGDVINIQGATNITTTSSQVNAIVVDGNGNMSQQVFPYNPQTQQVDVGDANQGQNASIYLTLFMMGFMWWDGYWVGHNGYYWNGHTNVYVKNVNWNNHWNNYWHNTWNQKWQTYYNKHKNDSNFPYKNNRSWPHHSGQLPSHDRPHEHSPPQQREHDFHRNPRERDFR